MHAYRTFSVTSLYHADTVSKDEVFTHHAKSTQQYMMAAPIMATALPSFWMPSCPTLG